MKNRIFFITDSIIILLILAFAVNSILSTYIIKKILEGIPKEKFEVTIDHFAINIFTGSASVNAFRLMEKKVGTEIIEVGHISVSNMSLLQYLFHRRIQVGSVRFSDGIVRMKKEKGNGKPFTENLKDQMRVNGMNEIALGEISLERVSVFLTSNNKSVFNCSKSDVFIYNTRVKNADPTLSIDSLTSEINSVVLLTKDSFYTIHAQRINIQSGEKNMHLSGITLSPNFDKKEFSRKMGNQTDRFEAGISSVTANGFDLLQCFFNNQVLAESVEIDSARIEVYRDKYFEAHRVKKKLIQEILHNLPLDLEVRTCRVKNSQFTYSELTPPSNDPSDITLTKMDATIKNISSTDSTQLTLSSRCMLNNRSPLVAEFNFPLTNGGFSLAGNVRDLEMKTFNSTFEPESKMTITNGIIDSMQFNLKKSQHAINGTFLMLFRNFRVSAMNPETRDTTGVLKNIKTEIANRLVIKSDNDEVLGRPSQVIVSRPYHDEYFITNNIIKTIMTGIQKSVK